jgi:transposase
LQGESIVQDFLGVDVSKAKLDAALMRADGKFKTRVFANDAKGFEALMAWLRGQLVDPSGTLHVCMEATGSYHEQLACWLHDQQLRVSVVNPLRVKRFAQVKPLRNKTDAADAKCLALFCKEQSPALWQAPSPGVRALQALVARLDTLQAMRQAESNRRDLAHPSVVGSIESVIADLDKTLAQVKAQIAQTIDDDPDLKQRSALLQTVPGLGARSIAQLLAYIGAPDRFSSVKALIAYASLAPMIRQSGTSLNNHRGTHPMGHQGLKRALYFPAMVAGRYNPLVSVFWNKLKAQGKPGKVIVVACMHKLLAIAYGVLRSGQPFNADHLKPRSA